MVALSFCPQTSFVQRASGLVRVVLATKVACQLPGDILFGMATESEVKDTTWTFHIVRSNDPVFVQSHVVDHNGKDMIAAGGQTRDSESLVARSSCIKTHKAAEEIGV